jgi:hypothetical protein
MHSTNVTRRFLLAALVVALPQMALAQDQGKPAPTVKISAEDMAKPPDAMISFEASQFGLLLGGGAGEGMLVFKGMMYPFTMKAGNVGNIGYTNVKGAGEVRALKRIEDFEGTYSGAGAGGALGGGKGSATYQNQNGVIVTVISSQQGAALNLGASGVVVTLKK